MSAPAKKTLLHDELFEAFTIVERAESADKRLKARGIFGIVGEATKNGRRYPRPVWEKQLSRLKPAIEARRVCGMMDHPDDGKQRTEKFSHLLTNLELVKEGNREVIMGEFEVLPTTSGKELKALIESGVNLGVSSRGFGTVKELSDGTSEVNEDYRLVTFDVVSDPAVGVAYPNYFSEGMDFFDADVELSEEAGGKKKVDPSAEPKAEPKASMTVEAMQQVVAAAILEEFRSLREAALAKVVVDEPAMSTSAVAAYQAQITSLMSERDVVTRKLAESEALRTKLDDEASKALLHAAVALWVEKSLVGLPEAKVAAARAHLGDVSAFTALDEVDAKFRAWVAANGPLTAPDVSEATRLLERRVADTNAKLVTSEATLTELRTKLSEAEAMALKNKDVAETVLKALESEQIVVKLAARPELVSEARRRVAGASAAGLGLLAEDKPLWSVVDDRMVARARRSFPMALGESAPPGDGKVVEGDLEVAGMSVDQMARAIEAMGS